MTQYQILKRAVLKVTGEDAPAFLQAIITNDIHLSRTVYAMMLSPSGRYLFDFFITNMGSGYILETDISNRDPLTRKLQLYRMRSRVVIEDITNDYFVIYARDNIEIPGTLISYKDPRFSKMGFRYIAYISHHVTTDDLYNQDKYQHSIPDGNIDLLSDKSMPQEYGMDYLNAISYTKGCYLGQEVICRTKTQGVVRKQIFNVTADTSIEGLEHGTPILAGGDKIGTLCSSYHNCGISLIRTEDYVTRKQMRLTLESIPITLNIPEWISSHN
jgi:folate-binding protein YgfZ